MNNDDERKNGHYDVLPPVEGARPVEGITINSAIGYLLDETGEKRVFHNQPEAEAFCWRPDTLEKNRSMFKQAGQPSPGPTAI